MNIKVKNQLRLRSKVKQMRVALAFSVIAAGSFLFLLLQVGYKTESLAAVNNDYRSVASGDWSNLSIWQRYNGSVWVAATVAPSNSHNVISIQAGHTVRVNTAVTVDQLVIDSNGILELPDGITMTLANGSGTDMNVSGIFRNAGTVTLSGSATIAYQSSGIYQHNYTSSPGTIPVATWNAGSTCEIIGYTNNNNLPANINQAYSNFSWNCINQSSPIDLNGAINTINGNLTIASTGSSEIRFANNNKTITIGGSYVQSGGTHVFITGSSQTGTINVNGNFALSGGTFFLHNGSGGTTTVNLSGNFSHTGGGLITGGNSATTALFAFNKTGIQQFVSTTNDVTGNIDFTVNNNSVLDLGNYTCYGRNFTLSSGGGLIIGSQDGISVSGDLGNVRTSGVRSFNSGSDYTYAGSASQITGSGLPATVRRFTVNNASNVSLSNSVTVSNQLIFTSGRIIANSNTLNVTSTSAGAITGHSANSYLVGSLRRSTASSGSYDFPIGTISSYQLINSTLSSTSGFSSILASFVNVNPLEANFPLVNLRDANVELDSMLNAGYWVLSPNSAMTGGSHSVTLREQGFDNTVGSQTKFFVLSRSNTSTNWQLAGNNSVASPAWIGSSATAIRTGLNSFNQYGIAYGEHLAFSNPTLLGGTAGQVGANYLFPQVCSGVDAWIQIVELTGGATLSSIDNTASGYNEAFQPFINIPGNSTASIQWRITFKVSGTNRDTTLAKVQLTGVDVDGGSGIREFVEATMPRSYALGSPTILTVTNLNGSYRATSNFTTVSDIDTSARQAMYQMNYQYVNSFLYRTGAISTNSGSEVRQTSLYFASFLTGALALPVNLSYFNALLKENKVQIDWTTSSETDNDYFTVERSADGVKFEEVARVKGAGNSSIAKYYSAFDIRPLPGISFYRLKQTDFNGKTSYAGPVRVNFQKVRNGKSFELESIGPVPFRNELNMVISASEECNLSIILLTNSGKVVERQSRYLDRGYNSVTFNLRTNSEPGIYFLSLMAGNEKVVRKIVRN
ncbi:MAG: T9SS C-terminal target domain-containing protein [Bacteroidetes bacterium]|nr:MAG: T9SS C-terminal target domain-containing protein [Bacteroidota bacterium]REK07630.1 MAG: T9SS C-terminal target domain-containing protein [Bacteroidota bacterium]REK31794.1 MAG: T9SS C-terminal target domain-containing protein [Bacteroidota bacterium]